MKKVILFLWFGDEKPQYITWTLENFRRMNPGWEIRYIEYSNKQLENYQEQNDKALTRILRGKTYKNFSFMVDAYKRAYLDIHHDELVVYCDLDCFPIAPFDNFFALGKKELPDWISNGFCKNCHEILILGSCVAKIGTLNMFKSDLWCMCNNKAVLFNQFLQLAKGTVMNETAMFHEGMIMNQKDIPTYNERSKAFHKMKIELGDNFCLPQFTPIEHYYSRERLKMNISNEGSKP